MLAIATSGCRKNAARSEVSDVEVVAVGDTSLMLQTVLRQIPRGLEPADSIAMFRSIVETWLRRQVLTEFAGMPVIFSNLELELNRVDFRGTRYYTFKDRSYVIDSAIIDSLYYTRDQRSRVVPGCKVSVMAMVDHVLPDAPLFVTARGAVNTISCPNGK